MGTRGWSQPDGNSLCFSRASLLPTSWDRRSSSVKNLNQETCRLHCTSVNSPTMDKQSTHLSKSCYVHTHGTHTYAMATCYEIPVYYCCLNNNVKGLDLRWEFTLWTTESRSVLSVTCVLKPNLQSYESHAIRSPCRNTINPNYHCTTSLPIPPMQLSKHLFTHVN